MTAYDSLAGDEFGVAVALAGDFAVVGAPGNDEAGRDAGAAYLFARNRLGADHWGRLTKLLPVGLGAGALAGTAVSIDHDIAVVGAPGSPDGGVVYVFARNQGGADAWGLLTELRPNQSIAGDRFGAALALQDGILAVGAPGGRGGAIGAGQVYLFERNRGGADQWGVVTVLRSSDPVSQDEFGSVLDVTAHVLAVGAPAAAGSGAVYLFGRNRGGADRWGRLAVLQAGNADDHFGAALAVTDDTLLVSAPDADTVARDAGLVYVFQRADQDIAVWQETRRLSAQGLGEGDRFGTALALSGTTAVVGAPSFDRFGINAGAAFVFERDRGGLRQWGLRSRVLANDTVAGDHFGESIALHGEQLLIGVSSDSDIGVNSGAAYAFAHNFGEWILDTQVVASGEAGASQFGYSLAVEGDLLAIGAPRDSHRGTDIGAVYLFARNRQRINHWQSLRVVQPGVGSAGDRFGQALSLADGILLAGAPYADAVGADSGAAYVFMRDGNNAQWGEVRRLLPEDAATGDFFGNAVAVSGDIAVVGAFADDDAGSASGAAYVFMRNRGGADHWGQVAKLNADDAAAAAQFGVAVAVDGDTIVVGAHFESGAGLLAGAAYVFQRNQGGADAWRQVAKIGARDTRSDHQFGFSVGIVGDLIVVGAPGNEDIGGGAAYLFARNAGDADRWGQVAEIAAPDTQSGDRFGEATVLTSTWLAVGARRHANENGQVYLFERNRNGTDSWGYVGKVNAPGAVSGGQFGASLDLSQRVLAAGAPMRAQGGTAYVFSARD